MSTEHLLREFYNQMYRVHTQPDNAYDLGDHLHHLTVHKHLDQDPFIQFREAYLWVDQAGARARRRCRLWLWGFCRLRGSSSPDTFSRWLYAERSATSRCSAGIGTLAPVEITGIVTEL